MAIGKTIRNRKRVRGERTEDYKLEVNITYVSELPPAQEMAWREVWDILLRPRSPNRPSASERDGGCDATQYAEAADKHQYGRKGRCY